MGQSTCTLVNPLQPKLQLSYIQDTQGLQAAHAVDLGFLHTTGMTADDWHKLLAHKPGSRKSPVRELTVADHIQLLDLCALTRSPSSTSSLLDHKVAIMRSIELLPRYATLLSSLRAFKTQKGPAKTASEVLTAALQLYTKLHGERVSCLFY